MTTKPPSRDVSRELFEKWAIDIWKDIQPKHQLLSRISGENQYFQPIVNGAWAGFQAGYEAAKDGGDYKKALEQILYLSKNFKQLDAATYAAIAEAALSPQPPEKL